MTDYRTVTACRLCDSTDLTEALNLGETPLANELDGTELFPLVVNRCGSCGHHQLSIAVAPERLWGPDYPYQSGTSPVFRAHLEKLADEVAALKPGGRVLELASNDGTLCRLMAERGLDVIGLDPSGPSEQRGYTVEEKGQPRYFLKQLSWPAECHGGKWSVILALNVFAHVDDLHSFTAAVKEALAPDGVFIVEVGYALMVELGNFDTIYHEHMSYHSISPLRTFFAKHGLFVNGVRGIESQGGSIRYYVTHDQRRFPFSTPVPGDPDDAIVNLANLRKRIDARAAALREALNKLFHRGEMVCIYGAPAKLTTLLYATGLQGMPFNCVFDDNPRKIGRTTPGMHLPIVDAKEIFTRNPDSVLLASWNFAPEICKRLREGGYKGGIINPMSRRNSRD